MAIAALVVIKVDQTAAEFTDLMRNALRRHPFISAAGYARRFH